MWWNLWEIQNYHLSWGDSLRDNPKEGVNKKEISPYLTNNIPDCEEKDAFGVSVSLIF